MLNAGSGWSTARARCGTASCSSPCSWACSFTYAEATAAQRFPNWAGAHNLVVEYLGGATALWVPPTGAYRTALSAVKASVKKSRYDAVKDPPRRRSSPIWQTHTYSSCHAFGRSFQSDGQGSLQDSSVCQTPT